MSRTIRGCCAGRAHARPAAKEHTLQPLRRLFVAWREAAGVEAALAPWGSELGTKLPGDCCAGYTTGRRGRARYCFGHNYFHCARCGMCRTGDPTKALKRNRGTKERLAHQELLRESREAEQSAAQHLRRRMLQAITEAPRRPQSPHRLRGHGGSDEVAAEGDMATSAPVQSGKIGGGAGGSPEGTPTATLPLVSLARWCPPGCKTCRPRVRRTTRATIAGSWPEVEVVPMAPAPPADEDGWYLL